MAPATKAATRSVAAIPPPMVRALCCFAHTLALRIWPAMPPKTRGQLGYKRKQTDVNESGRNGGIVGYWALAAVGGGGG